MRRGGVFAAAALVASGLGCSADLEAAFQPPDPVAHGLPPAELEGVTFEGYRGEQREISVTAGKARIDLVTRIADLHDVTLHFSEDTRGAIEVAAPVGELELDADDFVLSGGVVGSAQAGERFSTESVRYVAKTRELVSETPVELHRTNLVLSADGMTLGLDARRLRLIGQVQARVVPR